MTCRGLFQLPFRFDGFWMSISLSSNAFIPLMTTVTLPDKCYHKMNLKFIIPKVCLERDVHLQYTYFIPTFYSIDNCALMKPSQGNDLYSNIPNIIFKTPNV